MRTISRWMSVVALVIVTLPCSRAIADQQSEYEMLPPELPQVNVYEIAIPTHVVKPGYPRKAAQEGIEADVWFKLLIDRDGTVARCGVLHCSQKNYGFEFNAGNAARQCTFKPKIKNGEAVPAWFYYRVGFRREDIPVEEEERFPGPDQFVAVDQQAKIIRQAMPIRPDSCRVLGVDKGVWVKALVDTGGNVLDVRVLKSTGTDCGLEGAASRAAREYKFEPALQGGKPVAVWVTFQVKFAAE